MTLFNRNERSCSLKTVIVLILLPMLVLSTLALPNAVYAAEATNFGVVNYSDGSKWDISSSKPLVIEANGLSSTEGGYRVKITLAEGMLLKSFIWNNTDKVRWPIGTEVQGSALDMDNAALDFFDGGSATVDTNGNTILEYRVTGGVSRINLTDKIVVVPNPNLVYTNDEIQDAITIELLDKNGNPIQGKSESIDVTIVGDKITNYSYAAKKFMPGQGEGTTEGVHLYDVSYSRRWTGTFVAPMPVGKVDVTLGLPNCVSGITQVIDNRTGHGTKIDPSNIVFSETNHTVTIKNYEIGADEKDDSVELSIYGTISSSAATGTYKADPTVTVFKYNNLYDEGTATYDYSNLTNLSTYAVKITQSQSTIQFNASQASSLPQFPEGHYGPLGRSGGFFTSSAQSAQNLTWTFDDRLQVIGVYFPTETGSVNVTSVTLSNGQTYNLEEPITIDGAYQNLIYVNVADLHSKNSSIPENCFIKSITANCGNFSAGFAATSWYGKPIGRFVTGIEAGGAQTIPFSLSVNDTYTEEMSVIYDPTMDVACTNIEDTFYSDAARTKNATSFRAGSIIYGSTRIGVGGNALIPTKEPRFYIVVPQDMYFDPTLVTAHDWVTTTNSARSIREPWECSVADGGIKYNSGYVQDAEGNYYTCYEFYIPDTVISSFQNVAKSDYNGYGHSWYGGYHTSLIFDYQLEIADTAITKNLSIGDYLMVGKGNIKTRSFSSLCGINGTSTHVDTWDMDDNGNRSETSVAAAQTASITILDNMNITVSGYLTQSGGGGVVNPYDPGADGSNEVNVVEFMPNTNADYHVVISNTLVSIGEKCAVNAYIPIPKGTVNGTEFTAKNITAGPAGSSRLYQFNDFQWPMSLRATIGNVDPNNFEILYYLDSVTVNNDGKPSGNTTLNPSDDELERTVLVEIRSKSNVKVPSGQFEFTVPLKVGVNETDATTANLNDKKNIFRPRYYREGGIGDLWVNGNYVAARLGASSIGGYVFHDYNGNGIWDKDLSESAITGLDVVEIQLYSGDELLASTTPDTEGKYSFTGADLTSGKIGAGTYKIKFVRNNSMYVFTKNHAPTQNNYQTNSEAVASSDNSYAEASITLPYEGILSGYQEFINAGLFQDSIGGGIDGWSPDGIPDGCEARVDYAAVNGTISKEFEFFFEEDGKGGYKHTNLLVLDINPPAVEPDLGYEIDYWENSVDSTLNPSVDGRFHFDSAGDPGTPISITAYCKLAGTFVIHYNANGGDQSSCPADQYKPKGEAILIPSTRNPNGTSASNMYNQAPTRSGWLFSHWNTRADGTGQNYYPGQEYSKDESLELFAQWEQGTFYYTIVHEYQSRGPGDAYYYTMNTDQEIEVRYCGNYGDSYTIALIEQEHYTWQNWGLELTRTLTQTGNTTLSYYRNTYKLRVDAKGGKLANNRLYSEILVPVLFETEPYIQYLDTGNNLFDTPTRDGHIFKGWDKEVPEFMPANDFSINAQWEPIPEKYTIRFLDHEGNEISSTTDVEGASFNVPKAPERTGYRFLGWDSDVPDTMPDYDMTITAVYEPIEYTIRYILNGGEVMGNPIKYTIESNAITLNNPSRPGYVFETWTGTGISGTSTDVTIPAGSTGNREYTANWSAGTGKYTVKHYLADLEGGFSTTPDYTEVLEGTTGETTGAVGRAYTGFVARPITQETIMDTDPEKTVVQVYYDRKSYTFTWYDEDGSTVLDSVSAIYGSDIPTYSKSEEPTKAATAEYTYSFDKWTSNPTIVPSKVEGNVSYTASYTATKNKYTVTFKDEDGTVLKEATEYEYGTLAKDIVKPADPTKESTQGETFAFTGWSPAISDVTGDATYTATYTSSARQYNVTFVDDDGTTVLKAATAYDYNTHAASIVKPEDPTKASTAEYTYTFAGWTPEIKDVTADATYTATYTPTKRSYTITFKNGDDVLQSGPVEYGETPTYTGAEPTKAPTDSIEYTFAGWDPDITEVSGEKTYTAKFNSSARKYKVGFYNYNGDLIDEREYEYGAEVSSIVKPDDPTRSSDVQYDYTFNGWNLTAGTSGETVTGNMKYTASYTLTKRKYTITFKNGEDVLQTGLVEYGETPTYTGTAPTKEADAQYTYTFDKWSPEVVAVVGDATYMATFTKDTNSYTIKWNNYDGTLLAETTKDYGAPVPEYPGTTPPTKPEGEGATYTFKEWVLQSGNAGDTVTGNMTYQATYNDVPKKFTIAFLNYDGSTLEAKEWEYCAVPSYNGTPSKPGNEQYSYEFIGWDNTVVAVVGNATYKAVFDEIVNEYTIKWNDYDGSLIESETLEYGKPMPGHPTNPSREETAQYTYEFDEWSPDATPVGDTVTRDVTFTAKYKSTIKSYAVKFTDEDGTVLQEGDVEYGIVPEYTGETPTKDADDNYTYAFSGWDPALKAVDGSVTYKAKFTASAIPTIEYTFTQGDDSTWKQEDGKGANFRISRSVDDASTINHFLGIEVDGKAVSKDNYIAESGSVKLALKATYIDSLALGEHTILAKFDDGQAEAQFTVVLKDTEPGDKPGEGGSGGSGDGEESDDPDKNNEENGDNGSTSGGNGSGGNSNASGNASTSSSTTGSSGTVRTGDENNMLFWIILIGLTATSLGATVGSKKCRSRE